MLSRGRITEKGFLRLRIEGVHVSHIEDEFDLLPGPCRCTRVNSGQKRLVTAEPGVEKIIWGHGRRNFALRADGVLPIVCPIAEESITKGIRIFKVTIEKVKRIMDEDPAAKAGVFVYEIHPCRGFPGDSLR